MNPYPNQHHKHNISDMFWGTLWIVFMVSSAFYVFRSGLPQPSDWVMATIGVLLFLGGNLAMPKTYPAVLKAMIWFVGYVCLVNLMWFLITQKTEFLIFSVFYVFNLGASIVFWSLYRKMGDRILSYTAFAILVSVFVQSVIILLDFSMTGANTRFVGTFNNPNQLAHFGILMASICTILSRANRIPKALSRFFMPICYLGNIHAVNASLSRGGLMAMALAIVLGLMRNVKMAILFCLLGIVVIASGTFSQKIDSTFDRIRARFQIGNFGMQNDVEFWARNGIQRMWANPQYLLLGAGEGYIQRFESTHGIYYEIHSSIGTVIFSYGAIGFLLVLRIFWPIFKKRKSAMLFIVPVIAFGTTHNGLRQTEVWLIPLLVWLTIDSIQWKSVRAIQKRSNQLPVERHDQEFSPSGQF